LNALGDPLRDKALPSSVLYADPPNAWESLGASLSSPAKGAGYWDAPRGITCHFCQVVNGRLIQYQHIAGTSWNGNGRDQYGQPGPFEWSLMNFKQAAASDQKVGNVDQSLSDTPGTGWTRTQPSTHDVKIVLTAGTPIVERSVRIEFTVYGDTYIAEDIPKCDGSTKGYIWAHEPGADRGQAWIKDDSYIDYSTGEVYLYFKDPPELPDDEMDNVYTTIKVKRYGWIGTAVPVPDFTSGRNTGRPNPINILRTIRSYDPCIACSVQVVDMRGKKYKYEVVPVLGWEVK
jgi:Ni,Fe-hydrogenase I large subunit